MQVKVVFEYEDNGHLVSHTDTTYVAEKDKDWREKLIADYDCYKRFTPNFRILEIVPRQEMLTNNTYTLMNACRSICELGNRVRADNKIRNRQPLRTAYVFFSEIGVRNHMLLKQRDNPYRAIIEDELNVFNVEFLEEAEAEKFFNVELKPNWKVLGKKGLGQVAQKLKKHLESVSLHSVIYDQLKRNSPFQFENTELLLGDFEVRFTAKTGFASATDDKVGAVVLDIQLDARLLADGLVADFRSFVQNARKEADLKLTDRIDLDILCTVDDQKIFEDEKHQRYLKRDLLISDLKFINVMENKTDAHNFEDRIYFRLWKLEK